MKNSISLLFCIIALNLSSYSQKRLEFLSTKTSFYDPKAKERSTSETDTKIVIDESLMIIKINLQGGKIVLFKFTQTQFDKEKNGMTYILDNNEFFIAILFLKQQDSSFVLKPKDETKNTIIYESLTPL